MKFEPYEPSPLVNARSITKALSRLSINKQSEQGGAIDLADGGRSASKETQCVLGTKADSCNLDRAKKPNQQTTAQAYKRIQGRLWKGCNIACLFKGSTKMRDDMEEMGNFVNGIHEWGMGDYARRVVGDVEDIQASGM